MKDIKQIKKINLEISKDLWTKLKIISLKVDVPLNTLLIDKLEKIANSKKYDDDENPA